MADFYLDERLGEIRAAVVNRALVIEMHLTRDGDGLSAGARLPARLTRKLGSRGIAEAAGEELLVEPWPAGATEGETVTLEITRAAWREPGRDRLAKARPTGLAPSPAPRLASALKARGHILKAGWPSDIGSQWDDGFEAAGLGRMQFNTGSLSFAPTPAFTAVDVDGPGHAMTGAALAALARAIRLWGLGGSIVIDLPAGPDKAGRTAAAEAFDGQMAGLSFERTAINGFGLLQIICPRPGPSILERAQLDRTGTAAVALLSAALHDTGTGPMRLVAPGRILRWIETRAHLSCEVSRRTGRAVDMRADPLAGSGHVEPAN